MQTTMAVEDIKMTLPELLDKLALTMSHSDPEPESGGETGVGADASSAALAPVPGCAEDDRLRGPRFRRALWRT